MDEHLSDSTWAPPRFRRRYGRSTQTFNEAIAVLGWLADRVENIWGGTFSGKGGPHCSCGFPAKARLRTSGHWLEDVFHFLEIHAHHLGVGLSAASIPVAPRLFDEFFELLVRGALVGFAVLDVAHPIPALRQSWLCVFFILWSVPGCQYVR
jgi:hypothetical protein